MSETDNIKFSRHKEVKDIGYQKYDNYDAIEVPFTDSIPSDYEGIMGVPISFLDKYNPDQFEILGTSQSWDVEPGIKTKTYPKQVQVSSSGGQTVVTKLNDAPAIRVSEPPMETHYLVDDEIHVSVFKRIFIRHRKASS
jgi:hypothetical protein